MRTGMRNNKRTKASYELGLGNKTPDLSKLIRLLRTKVFFSVGLAVPEGS